SGHTLSRSHTLSLHDALPICTPIAPKYFITAEHVGGGVGAPFVFRGVTYTTTAAYDDASSDLRIWRICGTFPDYAQIYTNGDERSEEHTSELQSHLNLVCRLL